MAQTNQSANVSAKTRRGRQDPRFVTYLRPAEDSAALRRLFSHYAKQFAKRRRACAKGKNCNKS